MIKLYNNLILKVKKSLLFWAITLVAHIGGLLLIVLIAITPWQKFGLAVLIGASLWWQGRYGIGASACEIRFAEDGSCIRTVSGEQRRFRIASASVHPGFIRLTLMRTGERTRQQLVPRDAVETEIYRVLCAQIEQRRLPVSEPELKSPE